MTADFNPDIIPIENFEASKQIRLFQVLKQEENILLGDGDAI
jgi:hypothetical protein